MRLLVPAVAFIAIAAGCLGAPRPDASTAPPQVLGSETPVPLTDDSPRFAWSTTDIRGDAGILLRVQVGEPDHCVFTGGFARTTGRSSVTSVFAVQGPGVDAWGVTSQTSSSHVHVAGVVDTREESGPGPNLEARVTSIDAPRAQGEVLLLVLARDLEPWPSSLLEGASLEVGVACAGPFEVGAAEVTRDFLLADAHTMEGGAGAHVQPGGSVQLLDAATATARGDHGFLLFGSVGGAGLLTLDHPTGTENWLLDATFTRTFQGEPGAYEATLQRAGADFDYFFAALAGMNDVASLDEIHALPPP